MPRPADPDHRISHDALLSPGGVAGKVGGFYRAPDTSEYERARGEAAAIKARMAGNAIFGSDADAPSASSRPNTASRAPWGLSGDEPDAPPRSARGAPRAVEAAPWAHDEPEHKSASHRGRGRANAPSNVNTDHISYGNGNTGRMDADQRRITGKVGSGGDAAADMAAFVDARNEAVKHKQRQRGGGLW